MTWKKFPSQFVSFVFSAARAGSFLLPRKVSLAGGILLACAAMANAATILPVGPITFGTDASYDANFKEGAGADLLGRESTVNDGVIRARNPTGVTVGAAGYDSGATGGSGGQGGTGGPDTNNDLLNVSISGSVSTSARQGSTTTAGYLFRLDADEANGYLASVSITTSGVIFNVFENVGINTTTLPASSFSSNFAISTAINTLFPFKVTLSGDTFSFDFNNGAATATFTDDTPTATNPGQVGFWLRTAASGSNINLDNFKIDIVPEPTTLTMLLGGVGLLGLRRRRARA